MLYGNGRAFKEKYQKIAIYVLKQKQTCSWICFKGEARQHEPIKCIITYKGPWIAQAYNLLVLDVQWGEGDRIGAMAFQCVCLFCWLLGESSKHTWACLYTKYHVVCMHVCRQGIIMRWFKKHTFLVMEKVVFCSTI